MIENISIANLRKGKLKGLPFQEMKEAVLGPKYDLSVAFVSDSKIKHLNHITRGINKTTDILSFPLTKYSGEIYISLNSAKKEAKKFNRKIDNFVAFLFIHGLMHLKGLDHSSTMERNEVRVRKIFGI